MTDVASSTASIVYVYRNGDINFPGKKIVINRRKIRDLEALFEEFRERTKCKSAVRRVCTPLGKHSVSAVDKLEPGGKYVVVGRGKFQKLNYGKLPDRKSNMSKLPKVDEPIKNKLVVPGRVMEAYEGEKISLRVVYIHRNGDDRNLPHKILLKKGILKDMEQVLSFIQEKITFFVAIGGLYSLEGRRIDETAEIQSSGTYVAVERGRKFKRVSYCGSTVHASFQRSAPVRLPPIQQQLPLKRNPKVRSYPNSKNSTYNANERPGDNSRVTSTTLGRSPPCELALSSDEFEGMVKSEVEQKYSVIKQTAAVSQRKKIDQARRQPQTKRKFRAKTKPEPEPQKSRASPVVSPVFMEKKNEKHVTKQETRTKVTPKTQKDPTPPPSSPTSKPKPRMVGGKVKPAMAFHTHTQAPPKVKPKSQVLLDNEEDMVVAVDVFKASGIQREKGKQVAESRGVFADMPLDILPAEEVTEEITASVEYEAGNNKIPRESTVPEDEELNVVESIDIDVDNKDHLSDEESEIEEEATGRHVESVHIIPVGTVSPAPVRSSTEKNEEEDNYGSPSLMQDANGDEKVEEEKEENDSEGITGTSESESDPAQLERRESHSSILEEAQSPAIDTERDEKKREEIIAPISLDQPDENQKVENENNKSSGKADSPMENSNTKDAANDEDDDKDAGKEENSDPELDDDSDNEPHSDTVDDAATSPEIASPLGGNSKETIDAAAAAATDRDNVSGEGRSSQTEKKMISSDVKHSHTVDGGTEKESYFS